MEGGPHFHLVLLNPEIPPNTGSLGRTAVATGCRLHLIHPLGFDLSEPARRRAGLDYWENLDLMEHASWEAFLATCAPERLFLLTTKAARPVWEASLRRGDYLLFGRESSGVAPEIHDAVSTRWGAQSRLTLPMNPIARSLNLAAAATAVVYEGLRQLAAQPSP